MRKVRGRLLLRAVCMASMLRMSAAPSVIDAMDESGRPGGSESGCFTRARRPALCRLPNAEACAL
eukprot:7383771-Prymnesium_polylepis.1